jgi:phosphate starvation-inducible membrane PsiE
LLAALADKDTVSASGLLFGSLSAYFYREVVDGLLYFFIGFFGLVEVSFWSRLHVFSQFWQDLMLC